MDRRERVQAYLSNNKNKLDKELSILLEEKLMTVDEDTMAQVEFYSLRNPTTMRIVSILFGLFGIDRFLMGDIGIGVLKFFTAGGFFILWLIDIFYLPSRIKKENVTVLFLDILDHV